MAAIIRFIADWQNSKAHYYAFALINRVFRTDFFSETVSGNLKCPKNGLAFDSDSEHPTCKGKSLSLLSSLLAWNVGGTASARTSPLRRILNQKEARFCSERTARTRSIRCILGEKSFLNMIFMGGVR